MSDKENYLDKLNERRDFFQKNFLVKIGRQRTDKNSQEILKNSCPVCGYLTLDERNSFEICGICFWEDDGIDEFEENEVSGPNHISLKKGRLIFLEAKRKLISDKTYKSDITNELRDKFLKLDNLIMQSDFDKTEIIRQQSEIVNLLEQNRIYGLEKLFK